MKKEEINNLKPGDSVFAIFKKATIESISLEKNSVICLIGNKKERYCVSVDGVFLYTSDIEKVSQLVAEAKEVFEEQFDYRLVNKRVSDLFVTHWKNMCECENDAYSYDIMFNDFVAFLGELEKVSEKAKSLRVSNIPLLKEY